MPLVLVQNERTVGGLYDDWADVTGRFYHYPNQYVRLVSPGEQFVYYRGVRTVTGKRRPHPEYFGCGRVAEVWRDDNIALEAPRSKWKWFCSIDDYVEFPIPVPWEISGTRVEDISQNRFGVGVRRISTDTFEQIVAEAGLRAGVNIDSLINSVETPVLRRDGLVKRIIRDTPMVFKVKQLYDHQCQICAESLVLPGGRPYAEGHHIKPLGKPHGGPDIGGNILVLCPNHHVLCDYGAIALRPQTLVINSRHRLNSEFIDYHNDVIFADASRRDRSNRAENQ